MDKKEKCCVYFCSGTLKLNTMTVFSFVAFLFLEWGESEFLDTAVVNGPFILTHKTYE